MSDPVWLELISASSMWDPEVVRVTRVRGREALSTPYLYEIEIEVDADGGLPPDAIDDVLRGPCLIRLDREHEVQVSGVVRQIEMRSTSDPQPILYRLEIVPKLWVLSTSTRSRVFQEMDVPTIVSTVLEELGLVAEDDFEWRLSESYPTSEYTVQFQESDLDFVHRLLEHHGIFYFFEQTPDRERIVFGDANRAFDELEGRETIRYSGGEGAAGCVHELSHVVTPQVAGVLLREYNWRTPSVPLSSEAPADEATGRGFLNRYGEHFKTPAEGDRLAVVRAEEQLCERDLYTCAGAVTGLSPGHHFELTAHPCGDLDRGYLVTSMELERTRQDETSSLNTKRRFTAIPFDRAFRPARLTPRPKIEGIMHARVDGEVPGTAAPIDQYGRYKILFPFDLAGEPGGKASRWVRLAQPSSGAGYGIHFPLHIGVEVAVAHLDGDPDRPIIMNSPPNTETITPVTDGNPTQSKIRTKTGILMTWDDDC